jgi:hypothetical protein
MLGPCWLRRTYGWPAVRTLGTARRTSSFPAASVLLHGRAPRVGCAEAPMVRTAAARRAVGLLLFLLPTPPAEQPPRDLHAVIVRFPSPLHQTGCTALPHTCARARVCVSVRVPFAWPVAPLPSLRGAAQHVAVLVQLPPHIQRPHYLPHAAAVGAPRREHRSARTSAPCPLPPAPAPRNPP